MNETELLQRRNRVVRKTVFIALTVTTLLVVGIVVVYFTVTNTHDAALQTENQDFIKENSFSYNLGETVILDSSEDNKGFDHDFYVAVFGWDGTMELSIVSAQVYPSLEDAHLPATKLAFEKSSGETNAEKDGNCFLLLELTVHNINADLGDRGRDYFNISSLVNLINEDISHMTLGRLAYFDGTDPAIDSPKGILQYSLDKGEEKTFKVGLYVPKELINDQLLVGIGTSRLDKYTIKLGLSEESAL